MCTCNPENTVFVCSPVGPNEDYHQLPKRLNCKIVNYCRLLVEKKLQAERVQCYGRCNLLTFNSVSFDIVAGAGEA